MQCERPTTTSGTCRHVPRRSALLFSTFACQIDGLYYVYPGPWSSTTVQQFVPNSGDSQLHS